MPLLSGQYPFIKNKGFSSVNKKIRNDLLINEAKINLNPQILYQDEDYLTLHIFMEIEGGRSYSRDKYYVIDVQNKKTLNVTEILNRFNLNQENIQKYISQQLDFCLDQEILTYPEYCEDFPLEKLLDSYQLNPNIIHLDHDSSFYIKDHYLGISYDYGVASYAFEINLNIQ